MKYKIKHTRVEFSLIHNKGRYNPIKNKQWSNPARKHKYQIMISVLTLQEIDDSN